MSNISEVHDVPSTSPSDGFLSPGKQFPRPVSDAETSGFSRSGRRAHPRTRAVVMSLGLLAATIALTFYVRGLGSESTNDAQIEGHIIEIGPRLAGRVHRVLVQDNQLVRAGDLLIELERDDLEARVASARAALASEGAAKASAIASLRLTEQLTHARLEEARSGLDRAHFTVASSQADTQQAAAGVASAEARYRLAQQEWERAHTLVGSQALPQARLDNQNSVVIETGAALEQARLRVQAGESSVGASKAAVQVAQAQLAQATADQTKIEIARAAVALAEAREQGAAAALKLAELNLSYATITAPARGVVSQRSAEVGKLVSPERPLLTLVDPDDVWVVAAFKEEQIRHIQPGQHAVVRVDAYPGEPRSAHVQSIAGASGARFAVLPPDNATGNFVKVVQRIPVLLRFDSNSGSPLRPGMSVDVTITTRTGTPK